MKNATPITNKRIPEIGRLLAQFALDFVPDDADLNDYNGNDFVLLFDSWYEKFIRYVETNNLVTHFEALVLTENMNELDDLIKEAAIDAARETILAKV
jgi:hypothetical protein